MNGYDAVKLWRRWEDLGDRSALRTLILYNREDVVNLRRIMEHVGRLILEKTKYRLFIEDEARGHGGEVR